jgi:hypothetical protein
MISYKVVRGGGGASLKKKKKWHVVVVVVSVVSVNHSLQGMGAFYYRNGHTLRA